MKPVWSTACPDWERRIVAGESLIPFPPLFQEQADAAMRTFDALKVVSISKETTFGDVSRQWFRDLVSTLFGSYDEETGRRLIQFYLLLISKKNGKSEGAAGIMMTALIRNWRPSGQFSILSPTKEVANNSFEPALDMVRHDNELHKLMHVKEAQRTIIHRETNAALRVLAADSDTVGGGKNIGLLVDELHLFGKKADAQRMLREAQGGLASRPEGFVVYLTTQSDEPPEGVFKSTLDRFRDIRDGKVVDNNRLPILYEYPAAMLKAKAYMDPENFYITNPNLGASVSVENILDEFNDSKDEPAKLADFLAKRLNVEIGGNLRADGWAGANEWAKGSDPALKSLKSVLDRSEVVIMSIDGGGLDDLLGVAVLGREKRTGIWLNWNRAFIAPEGMERRKKNEAKYRDFMADGDLVLVERMPDDVTGVIEIAQQCKSSGKLHSVGLDAAGLGILVDALKEIELTAEENQVVAVKQGVALMGAIKAVERKLVDGTFKHGGCGLMAWCAGNVIVVPTSTGIKIERAESGFGKIDPFAATINCAALMSLNPSAKTMVYEERGLRVA